MPQRSRHAPLPAASNTFHGSRSTIPRHSAIPQSDLCFSTVTLDPDMIDPNFSLSSAAGSRHYDPPLWSASDDHVPRADDFLPASGYDSMSLSGSCFPMQIMPTTIDAMDITYDLVAGESLSRHAPLDTHSQSSGYTPEIGMDDYPFVDFTQDSSVADGPYLPDFGSHRAITPPPEEVLQRYFDNQGLPDRHGKYESTVCENLGLSKLQSYSASRHSVAPPRPIRPSSERTETQSTSCDSMESRHSPKEDHLDKVKARNDPLYDARPSKDGWYHCPWVKDPTSKCNHKPTKQKCIYSKYLDSHLRPYKCKFATPNSDCEDARFSSNACLFRHERETHGMHNHGHNPYVCLFPDCDRAKEGNGFPRRWNQRDHMKRMHGWESDDNTNDCHADGPRRRRGPGGPGGPGGHGGPASVPMRRSGSYARTQQAAVAYSKDNRRPSASGSRHQATASFATPLQACNMMAYPMAGIQFSQPQYLAQSRHAQPYVAAYSYQTVY